MKVRWTRASLRLRIRPDELEALLAGERSVERLELPGGEWAVSLEPAGATGLMMDGSVLRLALSPDDRARLSEPDREGVYFASGGLRYLVEKDFPCAHPRAIDAAEPATGTFPAPEGFTERRTR